MNCKELYEGLGHIAVHTRDMDESIRFYERIGGTLQKKDAIPTPDGDKLLALVDFARRVRAYVPTVMMTVVDTIPSEEIEHCRKICEEDVGATYRVRAYIKE